jgi:chromate transporter
LAHVQEDEAIVTSSANASAAAAPTESLWELVWLYLKLGTLAFGGPAAHIALMEDEVVRRRRWLSHEQFLDLLGASNLLPGPSSTELAIYIGYARCGLLGLLAAGVCFILPAFFMVMGIGWAYSCYGNIPLATGLLYGVKPVVIAIVLQAIWRLGRTAVKTLFLAAVGLAAAALSFVGVNPLAVLVGSGAAVVLVRGIATRPPGLPASPQFPFPPLFAAGGAVSAASVGLWPLFLAFLKLGCMVFGSGYVLLAFLKADLVEQRHWMNEAQLLDAVAVGQVTPGPVFTTATFIGYVIAGPAGATVATVGIFLPAFVLVAATGLWVRRLRKFSATANFLDGVNMGALALMAVVTWKLSRVAIFDGLTLGLAGAAAIALLTFRVNVTWLILAGVTIGLIARYLL